MGFASTSPPPAGAGGVGLAGILPPPPGAEPQPKKEKVDYLKLPCPVPFEEIQREASMSLKPELFEGFRFDFTKGLNQRFQVSHSVLMGSMEVPHQSGQTLKVPITHYEFGANFRDPKLMLLGRLMTDGSLNALAKCEVTENLALKMQAQLSNEPDSSHGSCNFDYKGKDYRTQFQFGDDASCALNYIQSITPHLSMGTELFWSAKLMTSGVTLAARHNTDKMIATAQVANTGFVGLSYVQKVSQKLSLASEFMYNTVSKDVTSSFGYDYMPGQCRLRGKIDSNGVVSAYLEDSLNLGVNLVLSAEIDYPKKNHRFGFGLTVGP